MTNFFAGDQNLGRSKFKGDKNLGLRKFKAGENDGPFVKFIEKGSNKFSVNVGPKIYSAYLSYIESRKKNKKKFFL